jgi:hypothetical protein
MFGRFSCFIRRQHHYRLRGQGGRVFMECLDCGHQSPGWDLGPKAKSIPQESSEFRLSLDGASDLGLVAGPARPFESVMRGGTKSASDEFRLYID